MIGSKEFAWCSAEPFARGRTMHAQFQVCNLNTAISSPEGVMSQYSTLARNGPGRRREDLAQRTPRNAGMSDTVESPTAPNKPIFLESHRLRASRGPCESSPRKG